MIASHTRALVWGFFALICLALAACASNPHRSVDCDPTGIGFWENYGCQAEWRARTERREEELKRLRVEHQRLLDQRSSLSDRIEVSEKIVAHLETQLAPSRARLQSLEKVQLTQNNYRRQISLLIDELEFLTRSLDAMAIAELGCETKEYQRQRVKSRTRSSVGKEAGEFLVGVVASDLLGRAVVASVDDEYKETVKTAYDLANFLFTMYDGYQRLQRIGTERVTYETYTEEVILCE